MKVTPKDFFLWVGAMLALYGSVVSFITLLFQYIDYSFPDTLQYYYDPYSGGIRFAMSALIVLVPVTIVLMRLIRNDIAKVPEKSDLWVRRWALFFTLFVAGATIVGDLITLINYFLSGDLTTRFLLKVAVILLVALAAFLHFLSDLRGYWNLYPKRAHVVGLAFGAAVLVTILSGFFIIGSPMETRLYRFDEQRVSNLSEIQWQIVEYYRQKQALPQTLADLEDPLTGFVIPRDPESKTPYTYRATGKESFELCATFNRPSRGATAESMPVRAYGSIDGNWEHGEGDMCFSRTIDPDRYPPFEKPTPVS